jgi:hypothetical protein
MALACDFVDHIHSLAARGVLEVAITATNDPWADFTKGVASGLILPTLPPFPQPGTKPQRPLFDASGERLRGKENQEPTPHGRVAGQELVASFWVQ